MDIFGLCITFILSILQIVKCDFKTRETFPLLVISFDGLRADRLNDFIKENPDSAFGRLVKSGVKADYMEPSFPSSTFPNHYTLVTGRYPQSHGIVGNTIYDPFYDKKISLKTNFDYIWWNKSVPIWFTARQQGFKTATCFWVGSEVEETSANIWMKYDQLYPFELRIKNVTDWMFNHKTDLTFLYYHEPDSTGHTYGPNSIQYKEKIKEVDGYLGNLMDKLKELNLYQNTNIVIVSDHGMAALKRANIINIREYVNITLIDKSRSIYGIVSHIRTIVGAEEEVYKSLLTIPNVNVYKKNEIPEEYNYRDDRRIAPIVIIAQEGYILSDNVFSTNDEFGDHGYNNSYESMHAIFIAHGPSFKTDYKIKPFKNVNIYSLICELMKLKCNLNDGSLEYTQDALLNYNSANKVLNLNYYILLTISIIYYFK